MAEEAKLDELLEITQKLATLSHGDTSLINKMENGFIEALLNLDDKVLLEKSLKRYKIAHFIKRINAFGAFEKSKIGEVYMNSHSFQEISKLDQLRKQVMDDLEAVVMKPLSTYEKSIQTQTDVPSILDLYPNYRISSLSASGFPSFTVWNDEVHVWIQERKVIYTLPVFPLLSILIRCESLTSVLNIH